MTYRHILLLFLHLSAVSHVHAQDQSQPECAEVVSEEVPAVSLLQARTQLHTEMNNNNMLPHDVNVNECDPTKPQPPSVGIFTGRFDNPKDAKVIVDIGGNAGADVSHFVKKHPGARIFTFEPVPEMFQSLQGRFRDNANVTVQNFGVSDTNAQREFVLDGVGSTGTDHNVNGKHVQVQLQDVDQVLSWVQKETGQAPDLLSMNCEGCEYAVMQRMAETKWLAKVSNVQLSWHVAGDVQDRVAKRCSVEKLLWQSHARVFQSDFGWVGWQRL